jgi:hypothetical protein
MDTRPAMPHNIEARYSPFSPPNLRYRVGYARSTGQAWRIYGNSRCGYTVDCRHFRTLAEVSAHLETL